MNGYTLDTATTTATTIPRIANTMVKANIVAMGAETAPPTPARSVLTWGMAKMSRITPNRTAKTPITFILGIIEVKLR